jgi:enamine deaminase RidA (YjgF/YER057c/UK114 family)
MARLCTAENVKILAFGTLAGGFLTDRWLDKPEPDMASLATWSHMKYKRYIDEAGGWAAFQHLLQTLRKIADQHEVSIANIASRYILEQPAVGGVIIGARLGMKEHIRDNLKLLNFEIGDDSGAALRPAIDKMVTIPGDCGDEYRKPPYLTASGDLSHHFDNLPPPYPTQSGTDGRTQALSGTQWEEIAGFSRAVRIDNRILVSGTTATHGDRVIGAGDPQAQTDFIIDKIEGTLQSLGGSLDNVVRTRIYIRNIKDWEAVSKVHGRRFGHIKPANTLVRADLVGEDYLVEMEAEAVQRSDK